MTTLDPDFLKMLVCPRTHKPLREATAEELAALNARIAKGEVRNRGGSSVETALGAGLIVEEEGEVYPIQEGIPVLLVTEAIRLDPEGTP